MARQNHRFQRRLRNWGQGNAYYKLYLNDIIEMRAMASMAGLRNTPCGLQKCRHLFGRWFGYDRQPPKAQTEATTIAPST